MASGYGTVGRHEKIEKTVGYDMSIPAIMILMICIKQY